MSDKCRYKQYYQDDIHYIVLIFLFAGIYHFLKCYFRSVVSGHCIACGIGGIVPCACHHYLHPDQKLYKKKRSWSRMKSVFVDFLQNQIV